MNRLFVGMDMHKEKIMEEEPYRDRVRRLVVLSVIEGISFFRSSRPGGRTTFPTVVFPGSAGNTAREHRHFEVRPAVSRETAREPLPASTRRQYP